MHAWESIQTVLDLIEQDVAEPLPIAQLAKRAALSEFYFQRLFRRLVGRPVNEYIRLRRLAAAAGALPDTGRRIADIALDCGFQSHQGLTRAFKDAYGITPEQFRAAPVRLNHFDKPCLQLGHAMVDEGVPLVIDGMVVEFFRKTVPAPRSFLGVEGHIPFGTQLPVGKATGVDKPGLLWEEFHRRRPSLPALLPGGNDLGAVYMGDAPQGHFTYFAGAESLPGNTAEGCARFTLPAAEYLVCGWEAENFEVLTTTALNKAQQYAGLWMERHGLHTTSFAVEMYYGTSPTASYMEHWVIPVPKGKAGPGAR